MSAFRVVAYSALGKVGDNLRTVFIFLTSASLRAWSGVLAFDQRPSAAPLGRGFCSVIFSSAHLACVAPTPCHVAPFYFRRVHARARFLAGVVVCWQMPSPCVCCARKSATEGASGARAAFLAVRGRSFCFPFFFWREEIWCRFDQLVIGPLLNSRSNLQTHKNTRSCIQDTEGDTLVPRSLPTSAVCVHPAFPLDILPSSVYVICLFSPQSPLAVVAY